MMRVIRKWIGWATVEPLGVAMPGVQLPKRIGHIANGPPMSRLSAARAVALLILVGSVSVAVVGLTVAHATQEMPSFEAASVKPSYPGERQTGYMFEPGGHFVAFREPVRDIVTAAYQLRPGQLVAAPEWNSVLEADFDIETRASGNPTIEEMRLMLRSLLAARFNLLGHWENRQMPIFALEIAKVGRTGPRFIPDSNASGCIDPTRGNPSRMPGPGGPPPSYCGMFSISRTPNGLTGTGIRIPMDKLVAWLGGYLDRPLVNDTGLTGSFDVTLTFSPQQPRTSLTPSSASDARDASAEPSIFTALQEQLGLRLVATQGPVNTFVVDHIEEPTPN